MGSKIEIRHRYTDAVLYTCDVTDEQQAGGLAMRAALEGAIKAGANLRGANLSDAYLSGAMVNGLRLAGDRPVIQIGPIGSESRTISVWLTEGGIRVQAGCFFGSRDEFEAQVMETHGDGIHGREYRACLPLIDMHAELWAPVTEQVAEVA